MPPRDAALGWLLGLTGFVFSLYHWLFEADLTQRAGELIAMDWVIGVVTVALVFEAARRVMGWGLPIICGVFLLYGLFGQYLPGALAHRGFGVDQIVSTLGFGTEGIYGTPTYVSSSYIFLFILFGAFLEQAGMINLFNDFAMGMVGHTRGGPAKVAVISLGADGHHQRLGRGQCGDHRAVHDSADEALWLQSGLCRRRGGHRRAWAGRSCRR